MKMSKLSMVLCGASSVQIFDTHFLGRSFRTRCRHFGLAALQFPLLRHRVRATYFPFIGSVYWRRNRRSGIEGFLKRAGLLLGQLARPILEPRDILALEAFGLLNSVVEFHGDDSPLLALIARCPMEANMVRVTPCDE